MTTEQIVASKVFLRRVMPYYYVAGEDNILTEVFTPETSDYVSMDQMDGQSLLHSGVERTREAHKGQHFFDPTP